LGDGGRSERETRRAFALASMAIIVSHCFAKESNRQLIIDGS
jgi:hypothetical protein